MFKIVNTAVKSVKINLNGARSVGTSVGFKEVSINVPWGHVSGKWWGPTDIRPVLTFHGWQDNCGTFDRLIPHLNKNVGYLCLDFPGHGLSSRLPDGMFYHSTDYLILIEYIVKYFGWPKVSLMGHSLGAIVSYIYGMVFPQKVDLLVCIDAAKPMIRKNQNVHIADTIEKFWVYEKYSRSAQEPPSYPLDEIKRRIHKPNNNSVNLEYTRYLMERNVAPSKRHPGQYYFTRDPRIKTEGLLNFSQDELTEFAQYMTFPIFIAKATRASYYEAKENFYEVLDVLKRTSVDCDFHYVEGTHHVHLNDPENVAPLIKQFIQRHNVEDRSVGGIKEEMISVG